MILADYALLKKRMMQSADGSCGNVVFCKQEERGAVFAKAPMRDYLSSRVCKKTLKKLIISER